MATNENQQINVFTKGMNTDTSGAYLSNEQYRYAENLRFITNTGENSGELRLIEGYDEATQRDEAQQNSDDRSWFQEGEDQEVIAATSIRNLVIFLVNNKGCAEIQVFSKTDSTPDGKYLRTPFHDDNYTWPHDRKYSLVTRWESDENVKLYIADGEHELMSLNIVNSSLIYKSLNELSGTNRHVLNKITWHEAYDENNDLEEVPVSGNIMCPTIQYCYFLYDDNSKWSDLSVCTEIIKFYKDPTGYRNGGFDSGYNTGKAVDLEIHIIDKSYQNIRLFRIEYTKNGQVPEIYMILDMPITKQDIKYRDLGGYGASYSFAEFLATQHYRFVPKLIESKNDYLFSSNVVDIQTQTNKLFDAVSVEWNVVDGSEYIMTDDNKLLDDLTDGVSNYGPSFMVGETYRFGIIYYTKDGRRTSVCNITDVYIDKNRKFCTVSNDTTGSFKFKRVGVKFTIKNLPRECAGYEVVRCERTIEDSKTITQGIVGSTFGPADSNIRYASTLMSLQKFVVPSSETIESRTDLVTFASPESSYQMDDVVSVMDKYDGNLTLREIQRYDTKAIANNMLDVTSFEVTFDTSPVQMGSPLGIKNIIGQDDIARINYGPTFIHTDQDGSYSIALNKVLINSEISGNQKATISAYGYAYSPKADGFNNGSTIQVQNDASVVDTFEYINWDIAPLFKDNVINITDENILTYISQTDPASVRTKTISSGKKCLLLKTDIKAIPVSDAHVNADLTLTSFAPISVVNIEKQSVTPYGGLSEEAYQKNTFYSFGDFKTISEEDVMSQDDTITSTINIYSGDVYNCMFLYNSAHAWESDRYYATAYPTIYAVPVQSRIDLRGISGDLYVDFKDTPHSYWFQDISGYYNGLVQDKDAYVYNTSYSVDRTALSYTYQQKKTIDDSLHDTRVHYSEIKTNGELLDSWTNFKPLNYLDVDSRYGEITNLRLFKDTLVFWQTGATGVLSVNERTMLQDVNDTNIILGNGDVLQRYDYLTTKYGMAPDQFCDTQSDTTLYWWDKYNKDLIMYPGGQTVLPMKISKTVSSLLNKSTISSPTLAYDNKYKEIIFSELDNGLSLAYSEIIQQFISLYKVSFQHSVQLEDKLLLISNYEDEPDLQKQHDNVYIWNRHGVELTPFLQYIVNDKNTFVKVYDNVQVGTGDQFFYNKQSEQIEDQLNQLKFKFNTTGQQSNKEVNINKTYREYDLRFAVPRNNNAEYCDRMRGKTMQCELSSDSSTDFSLQYIITKYRISWS